MGQSARKAFTLVELLVVIAIIALLVSILIPTFGRAKHVTRITACGSNARQIGISFGSYASSSDSRLPCAGRFYRRQQMRYVHYWTEFYPNIVAPGGWQNFGLLSKDRYMDPHGEGWFCPLQTGQGLTNPRGNPSHANNVPGPKNEVILEADAHLRWTFARTGFHRRVIGETGKYDSPLLHRLGPRPFLADSFSTPGQVRSSHGDSVNVWYGDGHATLRPLDPNSGLLGSVPGTYYSSSDPILELIWQGWEP